MTKEVKQCQNCKQNFTIEAVDLEFYERVQVPPPTFCHLCRAQRRMSYRNERRLYRRKSDYSGEFLFSRYPTSAPIKVYENDIWAGDSWNPLDYGREVSFEMPFLTQLYELMKVVPHKNKSIVGGLNSDYSNNFTAYKNCYLVFNGTEAEDCMYGNGISYSTECVDCSHVAKSELCYECFWLTSCSRAFFSSQCEGCANIWFCKNCSNCSNCYGSVNLRGKSYCFLNEQLSKEDYEVKIKKLGLDGFEVLEIEKKKCRDFWQKFPIRYMEGIKNHEVSGNYIFSSKNVKDSFLVREGENLRYVQYLQDPPNKDCYDHTVWGAGNELTYECATTGGGATRLKFCMDCWPNNHDMEYCMNCASSSYLFGCIALKNKQYCILNKEYSKADFESLREKIIAHMNAAPYMDKRGNIYRYGEFFPIEFSPYPYNDTVAQDHFSMNELEIKESGFRYEAPEGRQVTPTMEAEKLPNSIAEALDQITKEIIACAHKGSCSHECNQVFRILPQELEFYTKFNLPLPRTCINCRHHERISQRTRMHLYARQCSCAGERSGDYTNTAKHDHGSTPCDKAIESPYSPERKEIVYCEQCYQVEVN